MLKLKLYGDYVVISMILKPSKSPSVNPLGTVGVYTPTAFDESFLEAQMELCDKLGS